MRAALTLGLALCALCAGCARALHEPPPLSDLGGASPSAGATPADVDGLLARAGDLFARRVPDDARRAAQVYLQAARADAARTDGLIGAVRVYAWLVEHETDAAARADDATTAVQTAQWCERIDPLSAACAYWLGAALGLQAREKRSTGLDALPLIEKAFQRAAAADPDLEQGGPDRALALLYLRAPGWPSGPGDPDLGLDHARRAVERAPDYPPNLLALAEALEATGDTAQARETLGHALDAAEGLAAAGDPDAGEWAEEAQNALHRLGDR